MHSSSSQWSRAGLIAATVGALSSCLLTSSFEGLTGGPAGPDAGPDARPDSAAAAGGAAASSSGASSSGQGGVDGGGGSNPCPGTAGPAPVYIPELGFCIDSTEVTNAEYEQFLGSTPTLTSLPAVCSWKKSFVPKFLAAADLPVVGVDWCDAYAFCAWSGKRLCRKIGGGQLLKAEATDPSKSEWMAACSAHGAKVYPYALMTYAPMACNGADQGASKIVATGSLASCEGGYPGIFDMSGNAGDWEDACDTSGTDPALHSCGARGGDYGESPEHLACTYVESHPRSDRQDYIGFRCCSAGSGAAAASSASASLESSALSSVSSSSSP